MTSSRLASTTETPLRPAVGRLPASGEAETRRIEAAELIDGDRQRSLREELNEAGAGAWARRATRRVAARLSEASPEARSHLTKPLLPNGLCVVDEKA